MNEEAPQENTDTVLWKEKHSDHWGSFDDFLFVASHGGIGINVAGSVYVQSLKAWHSQIDQLASATARVKELEEKNSLLQEVCDNWCGRTTSVQIHQDKIKLLEAERDRMKEALESLHSGCPTCEKGRLPCPAKSALDEKTEGKAI